MRLSILLLLSLSLAACDFAESDSTPLASFEAEITGAVERSLAGATSLEADLEGIGITRETRNGLIISGFELLDDESQDRIALIGVTEGALALGEYQVDNTLGGFICVLFPATEGPFASGTSGSVVITSIDTETVSGSFDFEAVLVSAEDNIPTDETVRIEGTFTVDLEDDAP